VSQLSRSASALLVVVLVGVVLPAAAGAADIEHKRQEAARIAAELTRLQSDAFTLGGQFAETEEALADATAEVTSADHRLAELEAHVADLRTAAKHVAVQSYVSAGSAPSLALLLGGADGPLEAMPRDVYVSVVLGIQAGAVDQLGAVSEDATRQRDVLKQRQAAQQRLQGALRDRQAAVRRTLGKYEALQQRVKGELAQLVAAEQARQARAIAQQDRRDARPSATGGPASGTARRAPSPKPTTGPRPGASVPAPSPGAAGAVAAAMSQIGVPYRYATASPGEAFDCSGLTAWAWAQAGVSLPHQSRAQAGMLPGVAFEQAQPGDLIFYYAPIGHVAMFIGNGQLVHATRPGDVVKVSAVRWDRVVYVGRPG
jgi:peptidoglycan DL-endopeptidase CwlO